MSPPSAGFTVWLTPTITGLAKARTSRPSPVAALLNTLLQMHVATPNHGVEAAVTEAAERWADAPTKADVIGVLPENIAANTLAPHLDLTQEPLRIPVGISEDTLQPTVLEVYEEEHILIAGPARSGKSTLLCAIAELLLNAPADQRPAVWGISNRRSPLGDMPLDKIAESQDDIPGMLAMLRLETGPVFLLIDDADRVDDADQSIAGLLTSTSPRVCVVAAGQASDCARSTVTGRRNFRRPVRCPVAAGC